MDLDYLLMQAEQNKSSSADYLLQSGKELLRQAKSESDTVYTAKAFYYISLAYWRKGQIDKTMLNALRCLKYINSRTDPEVYVRINNILGNLYYLDQNHTLALEYYLQGLEIARQYKYDTLRINFMINIGSLYQNLNQHEKAIRYFTKAERLEEKSKKADSEFYRMKTSIYLNFAISYLYLEKYEPAASYIAQAMECKEQLEEESLDFIVHCLWCRIQMKTGGQRQVKEQLSLLLETFLEKEEEIDYPQDIGEVYELLADMQEYQELDRMLLLFERYVKKQRAISLLLQALDLRLRYYKIIGDEDNYQKKCIEYYELNKIHTNEANEKRVKSIEMQIVLRKQEKSIREGEKIKAHLQKRSEEDPLTRLGNRYRLEKFYKKLMRRLNQYDRTLTVGIIDIDFFKKFNDYYGHIKGDECLRAIAHVIASFVEEQKGICVRYGGDEFVILVPEQNELSVRNLAENIREGVRKLEVPHEKSPLSPILTVSQGYYIGIIDDTRQINDSIAKADESLYRVKEKSRDDYQVQCEF